MKIKTKESFGFAASAAVILVVFAVTLLLAIVSLGATDGEAKSAPDAPDSLVSAGAPRSQLELKRMFEAMSLTYSEGGLWVYEPVSSEYRRALEERIKDRERPVLSVEEILFIISDSASAYDKYDLIRFRNAEGDVEEEIYPAELAERQGAPLHRSALGRITDVSRLIELRVKTLSAPDSMTEEESGELKYLPTQTGSAEGEKAFVFGLHADSENYAEAVVFLPGNGNRVTLYPYADEASYCRTKVILQNDRTATEPEKALLVSAGADVSRSRNMTPEYFYGKTEIRLFVFGGNVILVDAENGVATALLPKGLKLTSVALSNNAVGADELYFTASSENGASVWRYSRGFIERLFESDGEFLAVSEPLAGDDSVSVFRAAKREDESFVSALECIGEPVAIYSAE